jgi:hypothetical protein
VLPSFFYVAASMGLLEAAMPAGMFQSKTRFSASIAKNIPPRAQPNN